MPTAPKTFRPHGEPVRRDDRECASKRGYNHRWTKVRDNAYRRDKGLCQDCLAEGKLNDKDLEVDHIIPVKQAPHLRLVLSNLRTLCKSHHRRKTLDDERNRGNG